MKRFEVIEDNGGGLTLAVFDGEGNVEYLHTGYECNPGQLREDLNAIKNGADPAVEWDGNEDNPQEFYDGIMSHEYGWEIVADNDGLHNISSMGSSAMREFGIRL